jgi:hypothetical protein
MSQETPSLPPGVTPEDIEQRAAIDRSTRFPVLFFFTSGAAWLLVATLLGLLAALKFVATGAFKFEVLNLARVQPAFVNALLDKAWKNIQPHQLVCPLDVHVQRVARNLNLIQSEKADWKTAVELTEKLKLFDPLDPVKYDIALFSMGVSTP